MSVTGGKVRASVTLARGEYAAACALARVERRTFSGWAGAVIEAKLLEQYGVVGLREWADTSKKGVDRVQH